MLFQAASFFFKALLLYIMGSKYFYDVVHEFHGQASQNMTFDCLFDYVFSRVLPEFTCFAPKIVLNIKTKRFSVQVNAGKNGKKHKGKQTIICHVLA